MSKACWSTEIAGFAIKLSQQGCDRFTVTYGKQIESKRSYAQAAASLGEAIMHALVCEDRLDNRQKGER